MTRCATLLALLALLAAPALAQQTFVVTSTADPGDGTCDAAGTGDGCTLREAITAANATPEADEIHFSIPGNGVQTIQPTSELPAITQPVVLDGYTQPGASPNTLAVGNDAVLLIEIDGSQVVSSFAGIYIRDPGGHGSVVRGLVVNAFHNYGVRTLNVSNVRIEGNFVGTDASGTVALGNRVGISVFRQGAANVTVGGPDPAQRNVASGNVDIGIEAGGFSPAGTDFTIQGNYVGTDASGTQPLGNNTGIIVGDVTDRTFVGGFEAGAGNVVSGNREFGIVLSVSTTGGSNAFNVTVQGNLVGVGADRITPLGNARDGLTFGRSGHQIGGSEPGAGNVIAHNGFTHPFRGRGIVVSGFDTRIEGNTIYANYGDGILIQNFATLAGVRISANAIYDSQNPDTPDYEVGINLGGCGEFNTDHRSPNDPADADEGPNRCQNYPDIADAGVAGTGDLVVTYAVDTDPANAVYPLTVEFFLADGEEGGEVYLGADTYTASDWSAGSPGQKVVDLGSLTGLLAGEAVVATATDAEGNTSEFSPMPVVAVSNEETVAPTAFVLEVPVPNPSRSAVTMAYGLSEAGPVRLAVYDALGREVAVLVDAERPAGRHETVLYERGLPSGVYLVRLTAGGFQHTRTVTLLR